MKKGDLLLCNNGVTKVKIVDFDDTTITIEYNNNLYQRPKNQIGQSLHYINHCWNCQSDVSSLYCNKCSYCGWYICNHCGSCHQGNCTYSACGFNAQGIHRNGTRFSYTGYDVDGYDRNGFNNLGIDREGYNRDGYNTNGYNREGYDRNGYNANGFNSNGLHQNGSKYDENGYDVEGYNADGFNTHGFDRNGYDINGYNSNGYDIGGFDSIGFNSFGFHKNGTLYDNDGFNKLGYDYQGYDKNGFNRFGYDRDGFNKYGYNSIGFDKDGFDLKGYDKDGYDRNGLNPDGYDRLGFDKNGLDSYWRSIIGKKVDYFTNDGNGTSEKRRATIINCYVEYGIHIIDIKFNDGTVYQNIKFNDCRKKGIIKLLKHAASDIDKPYYPLPKKKKTQRTKSKVEMKNTENEINDIFKELQDELSEDNRARMRVYGCFDSDDLESNYYEADSPDNE